MDSCESIGFISWLWWKQNASSGLDGATTPHTQWVLVTQHHSQWCCCKRARRHLYNLKCMSWCYKRPNPRDKFEEILSWEWEDRQTRNIVEKRKLSPKVMWNLMSEFRILHSDYTKSNYRETYLASKPKKNAADILSKTFCTTREMWGQPWSSYMELCPEWDFILKW